LLNHFYQVRKILMTSLSYNLTRQQAAQILWISTRTLDRRIRKWILSYKKVWNKILLAEEEIIAIKEKQNGNSINQVYQWQIVSENKTDTVLVKKVSDFFSEFSQEFEKFFELLKEKDRIIEEKNRIIFSLQHKIGEYENKLQNMIALPDYSREKEKLLLEKEKLEYENQQLKKLLYKERLFKVAVLIFFVFLILLFIFVNFIKI